MVYKGIVRAGWNRGVRHTVFTGVRASPPKRHSFHLSSLSTCRSQMSTEEFWITSWCHFLNFHLQSHWQTALSGLQPGAHMLHLQCYMHVVLSRQQKPNMDSAEHRANETHHKVNCCRFDNYHTTYILLQLNISRVSTNVILHILELCFLPKCYSLRKSTVTHIRTVHCVKEGFDLILNSFWKSLNNYYSFNPNWV